jgi:hypothetical protein
VDSNDPRQGVVHLFPRLRPGGAGLRRLLEAGQFRRGQVANSTRSYPCDLDESCARRVRHTSARIAMPPICCGHIALCTFGTGPAGGPAAPASSPRPRLPSASWACTWGPVRTRPPAVAAQAAPRGREAPYDVGHRTPDGDLPAAAGGQPARLHGRGRREGGGHRPGPGRGEGPDRRRPLGQRQRPGAAQELQRPPRPCPPGRRRRSPTCAAPAPARPTPRWRRPSGPSSNWAARRRRRTCWPRP